MIGVKEDGDQVKILFVDYGNKELKKISDVKKLPSRFAELFPIAIAAVLDSVTDVEKAAGMTGRFRELVGIGKKLKAKVKRYDDQSQCYFLDLFMDDKIGDVAVALGIKKKVELISE